jgi:Uma2 family endonuclease
MNTRTLPKPFTYDDYIALPDDGKRYEIIEGDLSMTPAPSPRHQAVQLRLGSLLLAFLDKHSLGRVFVSPIDLVLSMVDVVQPDLLFVGQSRSNIIAEKNIVGIPNLIIEILSPSSTTRDQKEKLNLYQRYGLPEYWIVDPDSQTVEVYLSAANRLERVETLKAGEQLHSRQIPGLVLTLTEIFK